MLYDFEKTINKQGMVHAANINEIDDAINDLQLRFEKSLDPQQVLISQKMVNLRNLLDCLDGCVLLEKGWNELLADLEKTSDLLDKNNSEVTLNEITFNKLKDLYNIEKGKGFKGSIEDYFSKLIMTIPFPEAN